MRPAARPRRESPHFLAMGCGASKAVAPELHSANGTAATAPRQGLASVKVGARGGATGSDGAPEPSGRSTRRKIITQVVEELSDGRKVTTTTTTIETLSDDEEGDGAGAEERDTDVQRDGAAVTQKPPAADSKGSQMQRAQLRSINSLKAGAAPVPPGTPDLESSQRTLRHPASSEQASLASSQAASGPMRNAAATALAALPDAPRTASATLAPLLTAPSKEHGTLLAPAGSLLPRKSLHAQQARLPALPGSPQALAPGSGASLLLTDAAGSERATADSKASTSSAAMVLPGAVAPHGHSKQHSSGSASPILLTHRRVGGSGGASPGGTRTSPRRGAGGSTNSIAAATTAALLATAAAQGGGTRSPTDALDRYYQTLPTAPPDATGRRSAPRSDSLQRLLASLQAVAAQPPPADAPSPPASPPRPLPPQRLQVPQTGSASPAQGAGASPSGPASGGGAEFLQGLTPVRTSASGSCTSGTPVQVASLGATLRGAAGASPPLSPLKPPPQQPPPAPPPTDSAAHVRFNVHKPPAGGARDPVAVSASPSFGFILDDGADLGDDLVIGGDASQRGSRVGAAPGVAAAPAAAPVRSPPAAQPPAEQLRPSASAPAPVPPASPPSAAPTAGGALSGRTSMALSDRSSVTDVAESGPSATSSRASTGTGAAVSAALRIAGASGADLVTRALQRGLGSLNRRVSENGVERSSAPLVAVNRNRVVKDKRPVSTCAVSLAFLLEFSGRVPAEMSTLDVVYKVHCGHLGWAKGQQHCWWPG